MTQKKGKNSESLLENNRSVILHILARKKVCTRAELATKTGLTQASITKIIGGLIQLGIVSEIGIVEGKLGRRSIGITFNAEKFLVIAVKLTRNHFDVGVFDFRGNLIEQTRRMIDRAQGSIYVIEQMKVVIKDFSSRYPEVCAMGMALPGPYLRREGRVAIMSEFSGWEDIDIRREFSEEYAFPVYFEHDANAGALALWRHGCYGENDTLVNFLAGDGIGAGIIYHGNILHGANGIAGEVGHMSIDFNGIQCVCHNRGCLETYCSALSFSRWVAEDLRQHPESSLTSEKTLTARTIFQHMQNGDKFSISEVQKVGVYIGYGIANVVYAYDPNVIVITDVMAGGGEILLESVRNTVKERVLPELYKKLSITMSPLAYEPILLGAATIAIEKTLDCTNIICK